MLRNFIFAVALIAPLPGLAQLQVFQFDGTKENPTGSIYQLPQTAPGDNLETRFHIRNAGLSGIQLLKLTMSGDGFRLTSAPSLGYIIAPGDFSEIKVMFAPTGTGSYSGSLQVNSLNLTLRGTVVGAAALSMNGAQLSVGSRIDMGNTEFGTSSSKTLTLTNPTNAPLAIPSITVSGAAFQGPNGVTAPLTLDPGQSVSFSISFAPPAAQTYQGMLSLDQRSFNLTGLGLAPPLPTAAIRLGAQTGSSGQQQKISIQLAAPSKIAATGTLAMMFKAGVSNVSDDAAVQFMSGPRRQATVTFQPGDTIGHFGSSTDLTFQTGTTSGQITFTLTLPNGTINTTMTIAPAVASFDTTTGTRRVSDLDVNLIGFDNTHSASLLTFTFYDSKGNVIQPGAIKADMTQSFKSYFDGSQSGGAFALRATFPVTGDATQVAGVDVQMTNAAGVAQTQRITF
jgi:hypothetical protein